MHSKVFLAEADRGMSGIAAMTGLSGMASKFYSSSSNLQLSQIPFIFPFVAALVAILLVVIIVVVAIRYMGTQPKYFLRGPEDLWQPAGKVIINRNQIGPATKGSYTLSMYLYIDGVPDPRAVTPLLVWPHVYSISYNSAQQELVMQTEGATETIKIPSVPMQRWTQVTITWEGRTANFYINGALLKSWSLQNLPPLASTSMSLRPDGCQGKIAWVQLWDRRLTSGEVATNYTSTSDSRGQPDLGLNLIQSWKQLTLPNVFCPAGGCAGTQPSASPSQKWEFPYA
jgi:hypothetical protein